MNYKLLIIVFSWLATIGGLFLFSSEETGQLNLNPKEQANILQTTAPTSTLSLPTRIKPVTPDSTLIPLTTQAPKEVQPTTTVLNATVVPTTTLLPPSSTTTTSTTTVTPTPTLPPSQTPAQSARININTANIQELDDITGVGPVIAQRIIDYRQKNGPFQKIEDIKNVNGIGDIKFEKMKNEITI